MKVENNINVYNITSKYKSNSKGNINKNYQSFKDVKEISEKGLDFSIAMNKFKELKNKDTDKIENLKNQILKNDYKIDSNKLARAILLGNFNPKEK